MSDRPHSGCAIVRTLFIPLQAGNDDSFFTEIQRPEFRIAGRRWNARNCAPDRPVVLSRGYGKQARLVGSIVAYECKASLLRFQVGLNVMAPPR